MTLAGIVVVTLVFVTVGFTPFLRPLGVLRPCLALPLPLLGTFAWRGEAATFGFRRRARWFSPYSRNPWWRRMSIGSRITAFVLPRIDPARFLRSG